MAFCPNCLVKLCIAPLVCKILFKHLLYQAVKDSAGFLIGECGLECHDFIMLLKRLFLTSLPPPLPPISPSPAVKF